MGPTPPQQPYPNIPPDGYPYPPQPDGQQPYPYPPQPQPGAAPYPPQPIGAPGGYPAAPAGAPPGAIPEVPLKGKQHEQQHAPSAVGYLAPGAAGPPPAGYPGAEGAAYPPPAGAYPPAQGAPATGYPSGPHAYGPAMGGMNVVAAPEQQQQQRCGCSAGWVLFAVGFIIPLSWMVAAFLPICTKNRNDRLAGLCSAVAFCIYTAIILAFSIHYSSVNRSSGAYYG